MPIEMLQPLKTGSLRARAVEILRDAIFSGQLKPGEPLRELHIARELAVSQATVREALGQLERFGLVVRTPNVGTHVTQLSPLDIRERIGLRALLEERAIVEAGPRMTAAAFDELAARLAALTGAITRNEYFEQAQADLAFHRFIWEQSGNRTLYQMLDQLAVPLFAFVSILRGTKRQQLADVVSSHEGIVDALHRNDPEVTRAAIRHHFELGFSLPE